MYRYDSVPDTLVINNTLQIVYAEGNAAAPQIEYDTISTLKDTEFVPVQQAQMAPADIEYRLDVFFDVSDPSGNPREMLTRVQTYDDGANHASCEYSLLVWTSSAHCLIQSITCTLISQSASECLFRLSTFSSPKTPSIFTALTMGNDSFLSPVYGAQTNAFAYPHMANIQLTVYNWDTGFHPFHLHGYVKAHPRSSSLSRSMPVDTNSRLSARAST